MITRAQQKDPQAMLIGSAILCFLLPRTGFYEFAALHLSSVPSLVGAGIVLSLTLQTMIFFALVALAAKILANHQRLDAYRSDTR